MFVASHWDNSSQSLGLRKGLWKLVTFLGLYFLFSQMRNSLCPQDPLFKFTSKYEASCQTLSLKNVVAVLVG